MPRDRNAKGNDFAAQLRAQLSDLSIKPDSVLSSVFESEPVSLDVFIKDKSYLGLTSGLSPIQYDAVRHIERVYYDGWEADDDGVWRYDAERDLYSMMGAEFDPYWAEPCRMINFATIEWGKSGGKDLVSRYSCLRIAYLLMCLKSPQDYFSMPKTDSIHMLNVATTASQATRAYFKPMREAVKTGWFADKCQPGINAIEFSKNIEAISGNSETESQEGLNLMLGVADEVDGFKSREIARAAGRKESINTVEGILDMMESSGQSRFRTFKNVRISYPRFVGSPIMRLMAQGEKSIKQNPRSRHYTSGPYATWEVNPIRKKSDFLQAYEDNPDLARAKYECKPSKAINPYFSNVVALEWVFDEDASPGIELTGYEKKGRDWIPCYKFSPDFKPIAGARYAIHADLAINGDRAGVAMSHIVRYQDKEVVKKDNDGDEVESYTVSRPQFKVDFAIAYESNVKEHREIQLRWARDLAIELRRRGFNVARVTFDKFQSVDSIQQLNSMGIESMQVSADRTEVVWQTFREIVYEERVSIPGNKLLLDELQGLNLLPGGRIDHPATGSKDLADAVACSVLGAMTIGGQESSDGLASTLAPAKFFVGGATELPEGFAQSYKNEGLGALMPNSADFFSDTSWRY